MTVGHLVAVVLMMSGIGAYFWARPSATERRLSTIRSDAMRRGLSLTTLNLPDWSIAGRVNQQMRMATGYRLRSDRSGCPVFAVMRTSGNAGVDLPAGWEWLNTEPRSLTATIRERVASYLRSFPDWVTLVDASPAGWTMTFDERSPAQLESLRNTLVALAGDAAFRS